MYFMWAAIFFVIAIVAGAFGFTDVAADASEIARVLFYLSLAVFLLIVLAGLFVVQKVKALLNGFGTTSESNASQSSSTVSQRP